MLTPPNGLPANAPSFDYFRTKVYFDKSRRGAEAAGKKVANLFASAELEPLPRPISQLANGAMLDGRRRADVPREPRLGADRRRRRSASGRTSRTGPNASIDELRERRKRIPFPLMVPTVIERSSWTDSTMPARMYWIDPDEKHKAVRLVYRMGSNEYWGVEDDATGTMRRCSPTRA